MVHRAIVTPGYRASPFAGARRSTRTCRRSCGGDAHSAARRGDGGRPEAVLRFRFQRRTRASPVTDLQPYLGAAGHVLIVSPDLTHSVHAHPDVSGSGPDLDVHAVFRRPRHVQAVDPGAAGRQGGVGAVHRANPALRKRTAGFLEPGYNGRLPAEPATSS